MTAPAWWDRDGRRTAAPEPPGSGAVYGPIGDFQGAAYERNAFTSGTAQEVACLWQLLALRPGHLLVDVGCGTGRHSRLLARGGVDTLGVDLSAGLLAAAARHGGAWVQGDARRLPLRDAVADAVCCLCQGGFGITPAGDGEALAELVRILRPGGRLALTAFSLVFAARHLAPGDTFDVRRGLVHSRADVRNADGAERVFDLWTACYSPAHLEDLASSTGLRVEALAGVEPGAYGLEPPGPDDPELLLVATKP